MTTSGFEVSDRRPTADPAQGVALAHGALLNAAAFLVSLIRAVFGLLVARLLGSAVLGVFVVAWATMDVISKITTFGLETTAATSIARTEAHGDRAGSHLLMNAALALGVGVSLLAALASFVVFEPIAALAGQRLELARASKIALLALPGVALYRISNSVSRGMAVMHHDIFSRGLTESIGTAAALLLAVWLGARLFAPEIAAILGTLAGGAVAFWCARRLFAKIPDKKPKTDRLVHRMMSDSAIVSAYDFLNIGLTQIDVLMLGALVGRAPGVTLTTVGIYAAAAEAACGLRRLTQVFGPIFTPLVARQIAVGNFRLAESLYGLVARWMLALLLPAVAVFAFAGPVIMAIFGAEFTVGSAWLAVIAAGCAVYAFAALAEPILTLQRPSLNLLNAVIATVVTAAANLLLIARLGPLGAALGTLVTGGTYGVLRSIEVSRLLEWRWPWTALNKPVAAVLLALPVGLAIRVASSSFAGQVLSVALFLLSYVAAWRWLGLEEADRQVIAQVLRRRRFAAGTN